MHTSENIFAGTELRVISVDNTEDDTVFMPHNLRLPNGIIEHEENLETAARRISAERINQQFTTSVARLMPVEGIQGYVVEQATGKSPDLRSGFAARAFKLDYILKDAQEHPEKYDATDVALLQSFSDQTFRR